jgi:hypothetical protein
MGRTQIEEVWEGAEENIYIHGIILSLLVHEEDYESTLSQTELIDMMKLTNALLPRPAFIGQSNSIANYKYRSREIKTK